MKRKNYFVHYQTSTLGQTLTDTLDEMVHTNRIVPGLANKVLQRFNNAVSDCFEQVYSRCTLKGRLSTYRNCDDVWTFVLTDVIVNSDDPQIADKLKIIACKAPQ